MHHHGLQSDVLLFGAMDMRHQKDREDLNGLPSLPNENKKNKNKNKKKASYNSNNIKNKENQKKEYEIYTTLHGYAMVGPYPSGQDVWYCDHKQCTYTKYGVYKRYKIDRWRSAKFGKKFTLCDGCVRQFKRPNPNKIQKNPSTVNVKLNINNPYPMQPMQPQQPIAPPQAYTQPIQYQQPYVYGAPPQMQYVQQPMYQQQSLQNVYAQPMVVQQPQQVIIQQQQSMQQVQSQQTMESPGNDNESVKSTGIQIVKQGWMMKKGELFKSWKKRYFVLKTNKTLNYYESDDAVMIKGTCSLNKVKSIKSKSGQSFEVDTPKRKWCFACRDDKVRDEWVQAIKSIVD